MNRAQKIKHKLSLLEVTYDELIDEVIEPFFLLKQIELVSLNEERISSFFRERKLTYNRDKTIANLEARGFRVEFECEDRPCGQCFFRIEIPGDIV